jgi:hypothetical protein
MMRGTTPRYESAFRIGRAWGLNVLRTIVRDVASRRDTAEPLDEGSQIAEKTDSLKRNFSTDRV